LRSAVIDILKHRQLSKMERATAGAVGFRCFWWKSWNAYSIHYKDKVCTFAYLGMYVRTDFWWENSKFLLTLSLLHYLFFIFGTKTY